jgi:hypothetical protein
MAAVNRVGSTISSRRVFGVGKDAELLDARVVAPGTEEGQEIAFSFPRGEPRWCGPGGEAAHQSRRSLALRDVSKRCSRRARRARARPRTPGAPGRRGPRRYDDEAENGQGRPTRCDHAPSVKRDDASRDLSRAAAAASAQDSLGRRGGWDGRRSGEASVFVEDGELRAVFAGHAHDRAGALRCRASGGRLPPGRARRKAWAGLLRP